METSAHDILIIGGGGAGLRAAIEIAELNPKLSVAMVSKVYPMRSHTVSAEGGVRRLRRLPAKLRRFAEIGPRAAPQA